MIDYEGHLIEAYTSCDVYWISRGGDFLPLLQNANFEARDVPPTGTSRWLATGDESDVIQCGWNKSTQSPAGTFSLSLKSRRDYLEALLPGDLLLIFMGSQRSEEKVNLVTLVLVDRVGEGRSVTGEGATVRTVEVTGRDFGKILLESSTVADPVFAQAENGLFTNQFFNAIREQTVLSSAEQVLRVLDIFYNQRDQYGVIARRQFSFPGREDLSLISLLNVTDYVQTPMFGYAIPEPSFLQNGNIWGLCESLSNSCLNEFFIDVRQDNEASRYAAAYAEELAASFVTADDISSQQATKKQIATNFSTPLSALAPEEDAVKTVGPQYSVALVHRQLPYDDGSFAALPTSVILESEIIDSDFGKATHDVYNFFRLRSPSFQPGAMESVGALLINESSIRAHGIRRMEAETRYLFQSKSDANDALHGRLAAAGASDIARVYDYYVGLLTTWYGFNERLTAGTLVVRFRPDIRIGTRIKVLRRSLAVPGATEELYFYCQALSHRFVQKEGASRTTLQLIRGVRHEANGFTSVPAMTFDARGPGQEIRRRFIKFSASGIQSGKDVVQENPGFFGTGGG